MSLLPGWFPAGAAAAAAVQEFPIVEATNTSINSTGTTNHTVSLPAGIAAGDILVVLFGSNASNANHTVNTPAGWSQLFSIFNSPRKLTGLFKIASGAEGASVAITTSANAISAHNSYRISGGQGTVEGATAASADPPSLTPSWGLAKTLWLAAAVGGSGLSGATTPPTNYANTIGISTGVTVAVGTVSARRSLEIASEDPSAWPAGMQVAATIAVRPA